MKPIYLILLCLFVFGCKPTEKESALVTQQFYESLALPQDTLSIAPDKDTLVTGSKGTKLFLKANSFVLPDGSVPKGRIKVVLKECYSAADFIRENLTTTANGRLLSSGGMLYVGATADGKELKLAEGKKYIVHFPKDTSEKKPMRLFYGNRDSTGSMNWQISNDTLSPHIGMYGYSPSYGTGDRTSWHPEFEDTVKNGHIFSYLFERLPYKDIGVSAAIPHKTFDVELYVSKQGGISNVIVYEITPSTKKKMNLPALKSIFENMPLLRPYDSPYAKDITPAQITFSVDYPSVLDFVGDKYFKDSGNLLGKEENTTRAALELQYYIMESSQMGWINCDYFWESTAEKIDFVVKVDTDTEPNVKLIFQKEESIMNATFWEDDRMVFTGIPINQPVKIVAIKFDGKKPLLAIAETKTGKVPFSNLVYQEFSMTRLNKELGK